jgi:citrate lyase gamma subunit
MSVTIRYSVKLSSAATFEAVRQAVMQSAQASRWHVTRIEPADAEAAKASMQSAGGGFVIEIDPACEHLHLLFDDQQHCEDAIKTQFAPPDCHVRVIQLLRALAVAGAEVKVDDDGGYWAGSDLDALEKARQAADANLAAARQSGNYYVPFALGGRILDMLPRDAIDGGATAPVAAAS